MPNDRSLLEREMERIELRPFTLDGFHRQRERKQRNQRVAAGIFGIAVFALAAIGFVRLLGSEGTPASDPQSPFAGTWVSTSDADGGTQTMTVEVSDDGAVKITVLDDVATVCGGTPSTMTGTGGIEADGTQLVINARVYTCDDGSEPETLSGPPLEEQLLDLTFVLDAESETLTDSFRGLWLREGAEVPEPAISGEMWPQSTLDGIRAAQERADAGDSRYTWQVDPGLAAEDYPGTWDRLYNGQVELVDRFLREVLGWEAYMQNHFVGGADGSLIDQRFLRCAPGRTNPLYPPQPGSRNAGESCAPTIDELTYESVSFDLVQPDRQGPGGIWVVSNWRPTTFAQADPAVAEAQATARLEEFLAARIDGRGAEGYVDVYDDWPVVREVPLLYATTTGAPYERFEFERVDGPDWPYGGYITFSVRLFADGGATVVEQEIYSHWDGGRSAGIEGGLAMERPTTTENGQTVPVPYYFFDDEIVAWVPGPWWEWGSLDLSIDESFRFIDFSDPVAGDPVAERKCAPGTGPADAATLAQQVIADPNFVTAAPVAASVGGLEAVSIDVARAPGATFSCLRVTDPYGVWIYALEPGLRQRLYLVDLPEGMSLQTLAITVTAHESRFDEVIEEAQPIIDSIEFRPGG
ncbi:MAG TPA: hypothetical protein VFK59_11390 [Actinomycetota bacterium]|nr:hypothetical protein [Actinomycetota bacterium]